MPFGCESCADDEVAIQNIMGQAQSPMPFGCESCADQLLMDFIRLLQTGSPMPFGCESCADGNLILAASYLGECHQCLSAVSPVRTADTGVENRIATGVTNAFRL